MADYVFATNLPFQSPFFHEKNDEALRAVYTLVVGLAILGPEGHGVDPHHDPAAFTFDLFKLEINQGGGGFRPYQKRFNFLNRFNNFARVVHTPLEALWLRGRLGAGCLTALCKEVIVPGIEMDARPTKAEDFDSSAREKTPQQFHTDAITKAHSTLSREASIEALNDAADAAVSLESLPQSWHSAVFQKNGIFV